MAECVCPPETYLVDGLRKGQHGQHVASGRCVDCGEGLECALGSDLRNFEDFMAATGKSREDQDEDQNQDEQDEKPHPLVQVGYYAKVGELTEVFKCGAPNDCPGGLPGTCATRRTGALCGHCDAGWKTSYDGCETWIYIPIRIFHTGFTLVTHGYTW